MNVDVNDLVNALEICKRRPDLPGGKFRTWHVRNTHGIQDLALPCDLSPPLYLWSQIEPVLDRVLGKSSDAPV